MKGKDGKLHATSTIVFADGTEAIIPHIKFATYRNCWFYTLNKCLACSDQFAEIADISCGDAWYKEIRKEPIKYSTILARTEEANQIILNMADEGFLFLRTVDPKNRRSFAIQSHGYRKTLAICKNKARQALRHSSAGIQWTFKGNRLCPLLLSSSECEVVPFPRHIRKDL